MSGHGMTLTGMAETLQQQLVKYQVWLKSRPQQGADLEVLFKWISYYLAGRTESRVSVLSELVYSVSRLLSLANRLLVAAPAGRPQLPEVAGRRLRAWLALLEYAEVFLELAAGQMFGPAGRWAAIVTVQIVKVCLRLILLYGRGSGMLLSPPLSPDVTPSCDSEVKDEVVVLPSTGRRVRSVETDASPVRRAWGVPRAPSPTPRLARPLQGRRLAAETLYVLRPAVQLAAVAATGYSSWPAWMLPLAADLASLHLHSDPAAGRLSRAEQAELYSRRLQLLLYLVRSPFYERHTRRRLLAVLGALARHAPLGRYLVQPVLDYLPAWQRVYFYVW